MGGELKNRRQVGVVMDNDVYAELKAYSERTMVPMSRIMDKAVIEYLKKNNRK